MVWISLFGFSDERYFWAKFVVRDGRSKIFSNMLPHIHTDQVDQPEGGCLGASHQRAGDGIHLINGIAILNDEIQCKRTSTERQPVSDKIGSILAENNPFAETKLTKPDDETQSQQGAYRQWG